MSVGILRAISDAKQPFTKLELRIAAYLKSRPESVALETSAEIAQKLDVSPMTISRFFKKLGYESSAAAKSQTKDGLYGPSASRIQHRFEEFNVALGTRDSRGDQAVAMAGIQHALKHRQTENWRQTTRLLAHADSVFGIGFQTMHYLAAGLCIRLKYIRPNVHLLDATDGVYAELFTDTSANKALIIVDSFRYGANGPILAKAAKERGIDVIVFCDEFCEWAAEITDKIIVFPSESYFFLGLPVGIHFGLNLLLQDVIHQLGDDAKIHLEKLSIAQELFGNFIS